MNLKSSKSAFSLPIFRALLCVLMGLSTSLYADSGFFKIDEPSTHFKQAHPTFGAKISAQENIYSKYTFVKGYIYDRDGKMIHYFKSPIYVPFILKKDQKTEIDFKIPRGMNVDDCSAVIVFGDKNEAVAITYPSILSESSFNYPEKKLVEDHTPKIITRKKVIDPLVEYVVKAGAVNGKSQQLTLFLRMPNGVEDPSEVTGVLVVCVLWTGIDVARIDMQQPELRGDYNGIFAYANYHKLAILAWGGPGAEWDPRKNYNDMGKLQVSTMDKELDTVADAWEKGVQDLTTQYDLPKKDYLLWGICGSAQWAQRLCLRKPDYFLATYMLIPGSFDEPTPGGSKVLWCLCTGDEYGGYENALRWYKECCAMGYPMIFKAYEGLGHRTSRSSVGMSFKFFDFALTQKDQKDQYDVDSQSRLASLKYANAGKTGVPWSTAFQKPLFYGDIVNQEVFPAAQVEMIPEGFRTPLPTPQLADYWLRGR